MFFQLSPLGTTLLTLGLLLFWLVLFIISLIFVTFLLRIGLSFLENSENMEFISVFGTALLIVVIVDLLIAFLSIILAPWIVLIIGFLIGVLIIDARHNTGFLNAVLVALIAILVGVLITALILIFIASLLGLAFNIFPNIFRF